MSFRPAFCRWILLAAACLSGGAARADALPPPTELLTRTPDTLSLVHGTCDYLQVSHQYEAVQVIRDTLTALDLPQPVAK